MTDRGDNGRGSVTVTNGVFEVTDLAVDTRWPRWAPRAAGLGIGALLAVHLYTDTALGALNLYSERPRAYDDTDLEVDPPAAGGRARWPR